MMVREFLVRCGHKGIGVQTLALTLGTTPEDHACWKQHRAWARETLVDLRDKGEQVLADLCGDIQDLEWMVQVLKGQFHRTGKEEFAEEMVQVEAEYHKDVSAFEQVEALVNKIKVSLIEGPA